MKYNQDLLDTMAVLSFIIGIANYNENLTQNDKDDIMNRLDQQTKDILIKVQSELEKQNDMLAQIMQILEEGE